MAQETRGYIKLFRSLLDWEWFDCPETLSVYVFLLLSANHCENQWRGITVKQGQTVTSYSQIAQKTGLTIKQVRTAINHLKQTGEVAHQTTNRYSLITIQNYELYQSQTASQKADERQAEGKQRATNKNDNNEKNNYIKEKNIKKESPKIPNEISEEWSAFAEMRKRIKKPLTDRAVTMALNNLKELAGDNYELQRKILNQSTFNCWSSLYPLKEQNGVNYNKPQKAQEEFRIGEYF